MKKYPLIIGNEEVFTEDTHIVYNKYTGEPYAQISLAGPEWRPLPPLRMKPSVPCPLMLWPGTMC